MAYDLTGKIKLIQDAQTFGSGFTKREMVVTVEDGKYPQDINLEFVQDKINLLDNLQVGQQVTVTFDLRGREYNGRYFNNLQGWKLLPPAMRMLIPRTTTHPHPPGTTHLATSTTIFRSRARNARRRKTQRGRLSVQYIFIAIHASGPRMRCGSSACYCCRCQRLRKGRRRQSGH